jgi:hypothetical protein
VEGRQRQQDYELEIEARQRDSAPESDQAAADICILAVTFNNH